jgi:hypothetical protein
MISGMEKSKAAQRAGRPGKRFDWIGAAKLIRERKPKLVEAGLAEDWGCTSGRIFDDGEPVKQEDTYVYLSSAWATPIVVLDGDEEIDCFLEGQEDPGYWPEDALKALSG